MPGIPVNRTVSSPPFPNLCQHIKTDDPNLGFDASDDGSVDQAGQLDNISNGLQTIGLKDKEYQNKTQDNDSQSKNDSQIKTGIHF